jgi:hypothetical protein
LADSGLQFYNGGGSIQFIDPSDGTRLHYINLLATALEFNAPKYKFKNITTGNSGLTAGDVYKDLNGFLKIA